MCYNIFEFFFPFRFILSNLSIANTRFRKSVTRVPKTVFTLSTKVSSNELVVHIKYVCELYESGRGQNIII